MKIYTISITGPVGVSYWLPLDPEVAPEAAITRLASDAPKNLADAMKQCAAYQLENVERELTFSDSNGSNQLVWDYCLSFEQRLALEFHSPDAVGDDGMELRGDGLASRHYSFEAESLDDAIKRFDALTVEELNAPRWNVWGIDLEEEVLVWDEPYEVDEEVISDIAAHLAITL
ncbi:hypothetical protein FHY11_000299 [Xanthomonas arboricola]|uniref:hypothetical protein n=1 Tax=Xanthomonas euroxanthea TaxID=2259622 RepID=UPI00141B685E|nr:hypothetical protein [Xanthomonas euroxanthea]NIK06833.1 hypothetical protein [Xanthomonas euroxanthea]